MPKPRSNAASCKCKATCAEASPGAEAAARAAKPNLAASGNTAPNCQADASALPTGGDHLARHRDLPMTRVATDHQGFTASERRACNEPRFRSKTCIEQLQVKDVRKTLQNFTKA